MREIVDGILYDTDGLLVLASANQRWNCDLIFRQLYRTENGRYFFVETYTWDEFLVRLFRRLFGTRPVVRWTLLTPADLIEVQQWCFDSGIDWEAAGVIPPEKA
ncbi:hypothetical protein [Mesorhizobium sp.]|uniref:hypothetical protein n=1 Tax=Mesorhizobium sp. TaxID=1871066 RepID=UPI00121D9667|nr:hypothetical protein [Mesorhizobium sp.]TIX28885.1 MAG: hypothetical protein E5V35_00555 [Mesorhizobium sp.]